MLVAAANAPTRQYYYYYAASVPKNLPESESTNPLEDLQAPGRKGAPIEGPPCRRQLAVRDR